MRSASQNLTIGVILLVAVGMLPCLGWVQWFGSFAGAIAIIVGLVGMLTDKSDSKAWHIAALVAGILGGGLGALRCLLGMGVF